ncbi:MAG: hypothetical protein JSR85_00505 [Proteobacteria bacterium]|nr:hypothetical protein [Pseudomonadota bacterium]
MNNSIFFFIAILFISSGISGCATDESKDANINNPNMIPTEPNTMPASSRSPAPAASSLPKKPPAC